MEDVKYSEDGKCLIKCPKDYQGEFIVPDGVTEIGDSAFNGCSSLTSIDIPNSVEKIGDFAFKACRNLTSINIPNSVTEIGKAIFLGSGVKEPFYFSKRLLYVPQSQKDSFVIIDGTASIDVGAFYGCSNLTSIDIPNSVTEIGNSAFKSCSGLTSINIPNSVKEIGSFAFKGCSSLTSIDLPNSVKEIGKAIFWGSGVKEPFYFSKRLLYVPQSQKDSFVIIDGTASIDVGAFYGCSNLTSIDIPNSVTEIGDSAFKSCSSLISIDIPNGVEKIGSSVFEGCSSLTSIDIPNSVTEIGSDAFKGCTSLTSIDIPNSVTTIGSCAFLGCSSLTSIDIPNSVTTIGSGAFSGCNSLTSIDIPNSVTEIGSYAFSGCTSLSSIDIPNSVTEIGSWAFDGCRFLKRIVISKSISKIGDDVFTNIGSHLAIFVDKDNLDYCDQNGTLLSKDLKRLIHYYKPEGQNEYTVQSEVVEIGPGAFEWVRLDKLVIQEGVEVICRDAFWIAAISSIVLPQSIKEIGNKAFIGCNELKELHIRHEHPEQLTVAENAFEGTPDSCILYVPSGTRYAYRHHPVFGKFKEVIIEK